jgi:hypothetical protein
VSFERGRGGGVGRTCLTGRASPSVVMSLGFEKRFQRWDWLVVVVDEFEREAVSGIYL